MVRLVHEPAELVGRSVEARRGEEVDPVVSPAESPGELCDRHELDERDPQSGELVELGSCCVPGPFACEGPHVQLVDHLTL